MSSVRAQPVLDPRWQKIEEAVCTAAELPPAERAKWLDDFCGDDQQLRAEIDSLLDAAPSVDQFLEHSVAAYAGSLMQEEGATSTPVKVGQYRILREIGRGGMGVVYLAEREDQFKQQVAIKLVKRGLDTEEILQRFRNERQILASLNHPNIAKLLDGGMTEDGLPYFVMEYIEGVPLTKYSAQQQLSINERLQLFRSACAAVQHAHQNLVVHRDLKPSNILVTRDRQLKLLDFGVAKLLTMDSDGDATMTQPAQSVMTPQYASPEQIRGQRVTTATDVYSLGVVLYELLTGAKPYKVKHSSPQELSLAICETAPKKPSEAVSSQSSVVTGDQQRATGKEQNGNGQRTPDDGQNQKSKIQNLKTLRGDLDNIVLMAMRKEPERRYKSAEQLAEDIERHRNGLPVRARAPTLGYRTTKFIQRNRLATTAAVLIFLTLLTGVVTTLWQAQAARREQAKAEEIKNFLRRTLNYSNPLLMGRHSGEMTVTDVLDEAGRRLESGEFSNRPDIKAELELIIAQSYVGQGKHELAMKYFEESASLMRQQYGENDPKTLVASSYEALVMFNRSEFAQAENLFRRILPPMATAQKRGDISSADLALALNNFGYLRRTQGDSKEAEKAFRQSLALSSQMPTDEWRLINGSTRSVLASTLADMGRFDEALQTSRDAVAELRQRGDADTPNFGFALTILGGFLTDYGDYREADADLRDAEAIFRKFLSPSTLWLGDNFRNQSASLYDQGNYQQALEKANAALSIYRESFGPHYDHYPTALIFQGLSLTRLGQIAEGERAVREALKLRTDSLPSTHYWVALAQGALGECLMIQERYGEAEPLIVHSCETMKAAQGDKSPLSIAAAKRAVALYEKMKKPAEAAKYRAPLSSS